MLNRNLYLYLGLLAFSAWRFPKASVLAQEVSYDTEVLPILQAKCFRCHNGQRTEGGLQLDLKEAALQGGDSGLAIIPGLDEKSLVRQRVNSEDEFVRMPLEAA